MFGKIRCRFSGLMLSLTKYAAATLIRQQVAVQRQRFGDHHAFGELGFRDLPRACRAGSADRHHAPLPRTTVIEGGRQRVNYILSPVSLCDFPVVAKHELSPLEVGSLDGGV